MYVGVKICVYARVGEGTKVWLYKNDTRMYMQGDASSSYSASSPTFARRSMNPLFNGLQKSSRTLASNKIFRTNIIPRNCYSIQCLFVPQEVGHR